MKELEVYKYDSNHPLDWRVDDPSNIQTLVLVTTGEIDLESTRFIEVDVSIRPDSRKNVKFHLIDSQYGLMFNSFCHTLIEDTRQYDNQESGKNHVIMLYNRWRRLFTGPHRLDSRDIRGLIGELVFLKDHLFARYGQHRSLESWMNLKFGKQDFIIDDSWFEVKCIMAGATKITISSLQQLDKDTPGYLVTVNISASSPESDKSITLNSLYDEVIHTLKSEADADLFAEVMMSIGYSPLPQYNEEVFELDSIRMYLVDGEFPRLRYSNLCGSGIVDAEYSISIDHIAPFEVHRWMLMSIGQICLNR